jgi:hypothetical protein
MNRSSFHLRHPIATSLVSSLLLGLLPLALMKTEEREQSTISLSSGTLILVGASTTDIVIAADSRTNFKNRPPTSGEMKIFRISQNTACTIGNVSRLDTSSAMGSGKKNTTVIDFPAIVRDWARQHSKASQSEASGALSEIFRIKLKSLYSSRSTDKPPPIKVSLICLGYEFGVPSISIIDMSESPANKNFDPTATTVRSPMRPGVLVPFGQSGVCDDLLLDNNSVLAEFKNSPPVQIYRRLKGQKRQAELTTDDLLSLSRTCLLATESPIALKVDPQARAVGPPNHLAVISSKTGFRFLQ